MNRRCAIESTSTLLKSGIDDALPFVPAVLRAIVFGYANVNPHAWQAVAVDPKPSSTQVVANRLIFRDDNDEEDDYWHTFVSSADLACGSHSWTIRFIGIGRARSWFGVGVTRKSLNSVNWKNRNADGIADDDQWIVYGDGVRHGVNGFVPIGDNGIGWNWPSGVKQPITVDLRADEPTRQIRIAYTAEGHRMDVLLTTAPTADEFRKLRPCVVLAGVVEVVLDSSE